MGHFPAARQAVLAKRIVRVSLLVTLDFASGPRNLWQGAGKLWAGGEYWDGLGELGSVSGLESVIGDTAPVVTFHLSGVDPGLVPLALEAASEVKGRDATLFVQFFDAFNQVIDSPYAIYAGIMDVMKIRASGPSLRTVSVTSETLFARRGFPPWGNWSDRDQKERFPNDRGFELVASMVNRTVEWPKY